MGQIDLTPEQIREAIEEHGTIHFASLALGVTYSRIRRMVNLNTPPLMVREQWDDRGDILYEVLHERVLTYSRVELDRIAAEKGRELMFVSDTYHGDE